VPPGAKLAVVASPVPSAPAVAEGSQNSPSPQAAKPASAEEGPGGAWIPTRADNDADTRKGFEHFYSLDYDKAIRDFEVALKAHPDDPFAVNHLLAAVTFKELYRIGALDTEAYATDNFLDKQLQAPLDPAVRDRVKQLTAQALGQEQARLQKDPDDVNALYARGATRALESTYIGLANHAWFSALRNAVAARHDNERVLQLDPSFVDAKVVVGTHLYIVGSLSWPVRVAASVAGLSGNKQKGLDYLRQATGSKHVEVASDARIVLALFLRREQKYPEAIKVVNELQHEYPRNFLMATEYAHLLNAAGHGQEAIAAYRKVLAGCPHPSTPTAGALGAPNRENSYNQCRIRIPAYGLGEALRGQEDYAEAAEAYELSAANSTKDPNLRQKAMLAEGEMYDLLQKRNTALEKYKAVIAENSASNSAELARHYMKQAYRNP
jgi:tetratricopeptide (TPR) repeat protein